MIIWPSAMAIIGTQDSCGVLSALAVDEIDIFVTPASVSIRG
jgi:hypothetical protein